MTQEPQRFRDTIIFPASLDPDAVRVVTRLTDQGYESYLVGGCVRDLLAGRIPKDFDVSTEARPRQIRRVFRNSRIIGRRFKLAHVHYGDKIIEVATFRCNPDADDDGSSGDGEGSDEEPEREEDERDEDTSARDDERGDGDRDDDGWRRDGRRGRGRRRGRRRGDDAPDTSERDGLLIVRDNEFGTAEEDVIRRDFTINALLYDVTNEEVIDYVGGVQDLSDRVMRTIGDAPIRLAEDPVRMLRAVKFTSRLDLTLDDELDAAMRSCAHLIERSAAPRVLEEIYKLLSCGNAARALDMLVEYGLLEHLLPEIADHWTEHRSDLVALGAAIDLLDEGQRRLSNGFLLAALFCPVWRDELDEGDDPVAVARDVISPAAQRMSIPRKDVAEVKQLLATLMRLERNRRSRRVRITEFLKRPSTRDAIQLLHLRARAGLCDPEQHARWAQRLAAIDPAPPAGAKPEREEVERPPRKRRRRRGGRRSRNRRTREDGDRRPDEAGEERGKTPRDDRPARKPRDQEPEPREPKVEVSVETPAADGPAADAPFVTDENRTRSITGLFKRLIGRVRRGADEDTGASDEAEHTGTERTDGASPTKSSRASAPADATDDTAPQDTASKGGAPTDASKDDDARDGDDRPRRKRSRRGGRRRGRSKKQGGGEQDSSDGGDEKARDEKPRGKQRDGGGNGGGGGGKRSGKKRSSNGDKKRRSRKPSKSGAGAKGGKSSGESKDGDGDFGGQRHPEDVEDFFDW